MIKPYLKQSEYAKIMGVSKVTVYRWIKDNKIKTVIIGGVTRIPLSELELKEE